MKTLKSLSVQVYFSSLFFVLLFLILGTSSSFAQDMSDSNRDEETTGKHSLHIEAFGRAFLFGSVNYEYAFTDRFSAGVGLGVTNVAFGEIERNNDGMPETGRYFDTYTTQMVYANYKVWKQNAHAIYATAGLTMYTETYRNKYPSETQFFLDSQVNWNAGVGYEYNPGRFFFRASPYVIALPDPSGWFPPYMPWLGISAGWKL